MKLLNDLTLLDLSSRLPGPYASYCLALQGAKVTKLENTDWGEDPFSASDLQKISPNFMDWYRQLNHQKTIQKISFKTQADQLKQQLQVADIILASPSKKMQALINAHARPSASVVFIAASRSQGAMHDLNALAQTETIHQHLKDSDHPPYLPFAGMAFGQYIAQTALAGFIKAFQTGALQLHTVYLDESTQALMDVLKSSQPDRRFLHNGALACYQVYYSQDQVPVMVAAVEEHYWQQLCDCFELALEPSDRYDLTGKTQNILRKLFTSLTASEIKSRMGTNRFCVTLAEKNKEDKI